MKYLPIFLFLLLFIFVFIGGALGGENQYDCLRIHIRANSNLDIDQAVKYEIKDRVVNYITPYLVGCETKEQSVQMITMLIEDIEAVCDDVLAQKGFIYTSKAEIRTEKFPTRSYQNVTLEEGVYDALIIELGEGKGDNWWCMIYPPLCFVNKSDLDAHNIQYQSYLAEIVKKFFN